MSSAALVSFRTSALAWADSAEDERLFKRVTSAVLIITAILCLIVLLSPAAKPDQAQTATLPAPMAKLLLTHTPPPIPAKPLPVPEAQAEAKADTTPAKISKPVPVKAEPRRPVAHLRDEVSKTAPPVPEARAPMENKAAGEVEAARRKVAGIGLLAAKDDIAQVRGAPVAVQLNTSIKQGAGVGNGTGPGVGSGNQAGLPARAMITANAGGGSGGINTSGYSRNTGGGGLAGRATTLVEGAAAGGGGGGLGGSGVRGRGNDAGAASAGNGAGGTLKRGSSGKASRSIEDIKLVFERNKGAIYAIYNRALREDPSLQGKVVVELKIAPTGEVMGCRVVSSELHTPELEAKLLARIRQFDFGAKDVDQMVVTWPVDFLPS
ncbi:AgmX/PglI C-terminal domain-containing protein [Aquabacterium sp.]|uniref:AgmX/PglI C-terminal domain-containing protein n=1 Tax=Aquabacterium sp. TaxID=1872578 RepID=UPI0025C198CB|nr:AgmX/PglI C-terminal domain-containing protein [Aquabacterium sp.]